MSIMACTRSSSGFVSSEVQATQRDISWFALRSIFPLQCILYSVGWLLWETLGASNQRAFEDKPLFLYGLKADAVHKCCL